LDLEAQVVLLILQEVLAVIVSSQLLLPSEVVAVETFLRKQGKLEDLVVVVLEHHKEIQDLLLHQHKDMLAVLDNLDHLGHMVMLQVEEVVLGERALMEELQKMLVLEVLASHLLSLEHQ
jgi:hypothetical protein